MFEARIPDFHKMVVAVVKTSYFKLEPKTINYRKHKACSNDRFREVLVNELFKSSINEKDEPLKTFLGVFKKVLDRFTSRKQKHTRGNNTPFMNKHPSKGITQTSILRNKFPKSRTDEDKKKYTKQRNLFISLIRKTKNNYYRNLNERTVTDNIKIWKDVKPILSSKTR